MSRSYTSFSCSRLLVVVLVLAGCGNREPDVRFVTTIPPLRAVIEPIAGEEIGVLVPGGTSPHVYDPKPSDARMAASAVVLFFASEQLDGWAAGLDTRTRVELLDLLPTSSRLSRADGRGPDPHFWMDPLAVHDLVPRIADVLCRHDPAGCPGFRERATDYASDLAAVHDTLDAMTASMEGAALIASHAFLAYFAYRYDLHVAGIIEEMEGADPSARHLRSLIDIAESSDVQAIATMPQHSSRAAETLASATGIPVIELDPIGTNTDLSALLYHVAARLQDVLGEPSTL